MARFPAVENALMESHAAGIWTSSVHAGSSAPKVDVQNGSDIHDGRPWMCNIGPKPVLMDDDAGCWSRCDQDRLVADSQELIHKRIEPVVTIDSVQRNFDVAPSARDQDRPFS